MPRTRDGISPLRRALFISLAYAAVTAVWLVSTDWIAHSVTQDTNLVTTIRNDSGWVFIVVSTLLLFVAISRQFRRYRDAIELERSQADVIGELTQFREGVINNPSVWVSMIDPLGHILAWNRGAEKITGYRREEVLNGRDVWTWLYPDEDYLGEIVDASRDVLHHGLELKDFETCLLNRDGTERRMSWHVRRVLGSDGNVTGSVAIGVDVTERRAIEAALKARERELATIMDSLPGMAFRSLYDEHWTLKFVSEGCRELTGYDPFELLDNRLVSMASLMDPEQEKLARQDVERAIANAEPYAHEYLLTRRDGDAIWVWEKGRGVDVDGELMLEGIILDISDRKAMEEELAYLAVRDSLTGLFNRRELEWKLDDEVSRARRYRRPVTLLWLDLDHFKSVNDQYGHAQGDLVLCQLSRVLEKSVRSVDIVGRYGGEEFIVILPELALKEAQQMAERLLDIIHNEVVTLNEDGDSLRLSVSIGLAAFPLHGLSPDDLFVAGDNAMYEAKRLGRNRVCVAAPTESTG